MSNWEKAYVEANNRVAESINSLAESVATMAEGILYLASNTNAILEHLTRNFAE